MGRIYVAQTNGITLAELRDFYEILAATAKPVVIHGWSILQTSDVGDAAEEVLRIETVRGVGSVTSGSGGTTPTAHALDDHDTNPAATVEANNTTRMAAGTGSLEVLGQFGWNVRIPWVHYYTPETRPKVKPGDRWTLACPAAPADALTFSSCIWFEEL